MQVAELWCVIDDRAALAAAVSKQEGDGVAQEALMLEIGMQVLLG